MFIKFGILLLLACAYLPLHAQQSKDTKVITISKKGIKDCIYQHNKIWILDMAGAVYSVDEKTWAARKVFTGGNKIVAIARDSGNNVIVADSKGLIFKAGGKDTAWLHNTNETIHYLVTIHKDYLFAITGTGIYSGNDDRIYYENAFSNPMVGSFSRKILLPSCVYLDKANNIWIGFDKGEWGGDLMMFSTSQGRFTAWKEIRKGSCHTSPVRSFFEADSNMYASSSIHHIGSPRSKIQKITDTCVTIFESEDWDSTSVTFKDQSLYIGPALYNEKDSSFYFYCQFGVFKSNNKKSTKNMSDWERVLVPELQWTYGQPKAVGYAMNVTRMFFASDKLFLVSPENGVLVWDGKEKVLLY